MEKGRTLWRLFSCCWATMCCCMAAICWVMRKAGWNMPASDEIADPKGGELIGEAVVVPVMWGVGYIEGGGVEWGRW